MEMSQTIFKPFLSAQNDIGWRTIAGRLQRPRQSLLRSVKPPSISAPSRMRVRMRSISLDKTHSGISIAIIFLPRLRLGKGIGT